MLLLADIRLAFFAALTAMTINISVIMHEARTPDYDNITIEQLASLSIQELSLIKVKV